MAPDVNLRDYYLQFVHNAKSDKEQYIKSLEETAKIKEEVYNYIDENKEILLKEFNIDITKFDKEWVNKTYNEEETLYKQVIKLFKLDSDNKYRIIILQVIKYCKLLANENKFRKLIAISDRRNNLKYKDYQTIVSNYYNKVHKCILEGYAYKYGYGIGTLFINRITLKNSNIRKVNRIDFKATNEKKKELLAKGIKLYDDKEAAWYKARGIPYDGVDYRVFKVDDYIYRFDFAKSFVCNCRRPDYERTEYVNSKLRGMSYQQIADTYVNSEADIHSLPVDIRYKLNILLYKYPTKYLNFIRNVE